MKSMKQRNQEQPNDLQSRAAQIKASVDEVTELIKHILERLTDLLEFVERFAFRITSVIGVLVIITYYLLHKLI